MEGKGGKSPKVQEVRRSISGRGGGTHEKKLDAVQRPIWNLRERKRGKGNPRRGLRDIGKTTTYYDRGFNSRDLGLG